MLVFYPLAKETTTILCLLTKPIHLHQTNKNNPYCADTESVAEREEGPPNGDDTGDDSIQAGVPFPNHDLPDLSKH